MGAVVEIADRHGGYSYRDSTAADGRTGRMLPHAGVWLVRLLPDPAYRIPDTEENPRRLRLDDYEHRRVQFVVERP